MRPNGIKEPLGYIYKPAKMTPKQELNHIISEATIALEQKGSILYPTETVWGIGCDATSREAVEKIFKIKERDQEKSLIVLVADIEMLKMYVPKINKNTIDIINTFPKPLTIIYEHAKGLANNVYNKNGSIAIRLIKHDFCQQLISAFKKPIVSTSANISGQATPLSFHSISQDILKRVDYVVNLPFLTGSGVPSTIGKMDEDGKLVIIRP